VILPVIIATAVIGLLYWTIQPAFLQWDPIQFALALNKFDMPRHSPHPPGYLLHIAIAYILKTMGIDPQHAIISSSIIISMAVIVVVFIFLTRLRINQWIALVFSIAVALHPLMLTYGTNGSVYPMDALFFPLLLLLAMRALDSPDKKGLYVWFFMWGLSGGARQNITLFMLPLAIYLLIKRRVDLKILAKSLGVAALGLMLWLLPLLWLTHGPRPLIHAFSAQFFSGWGHSLSMLYGASWPMVKMNLLTLLRWSVLAFNIFILLIPVAFSGRQKKPALFVLLLGILPPYAWFILMYIGKPGHLVFGVPLIAILAAMGAQNLFDRSKTSRYIGLTISLLFPIVLAWQFFAGPAWIYRLDAPITYKIRAYQDQKTGILLRTIQKTTKNAPNSAMVICRDGDLSFRQAMFYLPKLPVVWLIDRESTGLNLHGTTACFAKNRKIRCLFKGPFWYQKNYPTITQIPIPTTINRLFFFWETNSDFGRAAKHRLAISRLSSAPHTPFFAWTTAWNHKSIRVKDYIFVSEQ